MIYLFIDNNQIKLLHLKKSLLGQYEANYVEKKFEIDLLENGAIKNIDVMASSIKEGLQRLPEGYDNHIFLILPQNSFSFVKADVPKDIAPSAIESFIVDKARSSLSIDLNNCFFDYFLNDVDDQKQVNFYSITNNVLEGYIETLNLLGLKLVFILPETLAIFKLFEKTLRKEKKENILYVSSDKSQAYGFLYDTGGLHSDEKWQVDIGESKKLEDVIKEKAAKYEQDGTGLNRIMLSGSGSENIRQDTFTKNVGVWTNPLKRIIPNFYQDYIKMIVTQSDKSFPILSFDMCFGAFVFAQENKDFNILKKQKKGFKKIRSGNGPSPVKKEVYIFLIAAVVSFTAFYFLSQVNLKLPKLSLFSKPTPTPVKKITPTPTPTINKEKLKIKILNGSGVAGKASELEDVLKEKEYQEIVTGNADNYDYTITEIGVKKSKTYIANFLKKELSEYIKSPKITTIDNDETSDVIIIIGTDFK
jgi:hypothetical protein